ncbi:MAG: hypothetical protein GTN35_03765 [Nitrososphaeria archaeon]|nr:hypothetical protein [Nitrosopumilaceae archaeon]NIP10136.1 hypothetical protein [Nitrosopumilaceae archaeon]NIP91500.1 hypothetical protein [Nitrososphaeria archaeon]NIS95335.1 hypothetical protein [Nitrosopumilaceae archaeon]
MNFSNLFGKVMAIDYKIRYAAIQNSVGEKLHGGFREGINPILNDDELKMMHYYASQRWQTRKNIEHKLGNTKYAMAEYDKLKRISFPIDEKHLLMITTEINSNHIDIIQNILKLLKENNTSG